jgi:hypothetical protein
LLQIKAGRGKRRDVVLVKTKSWSERMSFEGMLFLSGVLLAFVLFMGALAWADRQTRLARREAEEVRKRDRDSTITQGSWPDRRAA